jgi:hypothetical protein
MHQKWLLKSGGATLPHCVRFSSSQQGSRSDLQTSTLQDNFTFHLDFAGPMRPVADNEVNQVKGVADLMRFCTNSRKCIQRFYDDKNYGWKQ